jgi:hypothetical protein
VAAALAGKGCRVIGVDCVPPANAAAFARFMLQDLNEGVPDPGEPIDYILALDILEQLHSPERFLEELHLLTSKNRNLRLVVSTGNVAFAVTRLMLLAGQFNYGPRGILDLTHTRLFTFASLKRLLRDTAFVVDETVGIPAPFPLALGQRRVARVLLSLNRLFIRLWRGFFSYQMLMLCRPVPALDWLLDDAMQASLARIEARPAEAAQASAG